MLATLLTNCIDLPWVTALEQRGYSHFPHVHFLGDYYTESFEMIVSPLKKKRP